MKLYRAHPQDREDLVTLWPLCSYANLLEAADAFTNAYPHAPEDECLAECITEVTRDAATG